MNTQKEKIKALRAEARRLGMTFKEASVSGWWCLTDRKTGRTLSKPAPLSYWEGAYINGDFIEYAS